MVNYFRADEPQLVLILIVAPLLLLLAAGIFFWIRNSPPSTVSFPTFSVSYSRVGREDVYIYYRDGKKTFEFYAGPANRKHLQLSARQELSDEEVRGVIPNLAIGLAKLGFRQYTIRKYGEGQIIASSC